MIAAIDYGSCWIRSVFSKSADSRATDHAYGAIEYAMMTVIPPSIAIRWMSCVSLMRNVKGSLVVPGNHAEKIQWLSRVPRTPLLSDGCFRGRSAGPTNAACDHSGDPSAGFGITTCLCNHSPRSERHFVQAAANEEFLCRLIRMNGFRPLVVNPAEAVMLATGSDATSRVTS